MHSDGVITLKLKDNKIYVINKQTPNKQIWLSSPFSYFLFRGPKRYEFIENNWVNLTDQHKLIDLLSKELSMATNTDIKIEVE